MKRFVLSLIGVLVTSSVANAAPGPQKLIQVVPRIEVPGGRSLTRARLSCFFSPLPNGNVRPTIRNVSFSTFSAGSHIVLLADDALFIQFDLPKELRRGETFMADLEYRSTAKVCVAAHMPMNLVAAPPVP
jgi:hypothetical protein